jgi:hypothetical protein
MVLINDELVGLELEKYIVLRLAENNGSIEKISEDFGNDVHFISRVIKFLEDHAWIKQDGFGDCQMTDSISLKISSSKIVAYNKYNRLLD